MCHTSTKQLKFCRTPTVAGYDTLTSYPVSGLRSSRLYLQIRARTCVAQVCNPGCSRSEYLTDSEPKRNISLLQDCPGIRFRSRPDTYLACSVISRSNTHEAIARWRDMCWPVNQREGLRCWAWLRFRLRRGHAGPCIELTAELQCSAWEKLPTSHEQPWPGWWIYISGNYNIYTVHWPFARFLRMSRFCNVLWVIKVCECMQYPKKNQGGCGDGVTSDKALFWHLIAIPKLPSALQYSVQLLQAAVTYLQTF